MELTEKNCIYWDEIVDPFIGCYPTGPECDDCWAKQDVHRFSCNPKFGKDEENRYHGLTLKDDDGTTRWTGEVRTDLNAFEKPISRKKPTVYAVCFRSDLFHQDIVTRKLTYLHNFFNVMKQCPQHVFIILTKRPENIAPALYSSGYLKRDQFLSNVILMTSAGTQANVDRRVFSLMRLRTLARWPVLGVSVEPMLEGINLTRFLPDIDDPTKPAIDWAIIGGKSKAADFPLKPAHASTLINQCLTAKTPVMFKQWGEWGPIPREWLEEYYAKLEADNPDTPMDELEEDFPPRSYNGKKTIRYSQYNVIANMGKKAAGRTVDGETYTGLPSRLEEYIAKKEG